MFCLRLPSGFYFRKLNSRRNYQYSNSSSSGKELRMDDNSEELAFVVEDAKETIIVPAIEAVLKNQDFDQVKVDQWTDTICESTMKGLVDLQKPFKYIGKSLPLLFVVRLYFSFATRYGRFLIHLMHVHVVVRLSI